MNDDGTKTGLKNREFGKLLKGVSITFLATFFALFFSYLIFDAPNNKYNFSMNFEEKKEGDLVRKFVKELRTPGEFITYNDFFKRFNSEGEYWNHKLKADNLFASLLLNSNLKKYEDYYKKTTIFRKIIYALQVCINSTIADVYVQDNCHVKYEFFHKNGIPPKDSLDYQTRQLYVFELTTWNDKLENFKAQAVHDLAMRESLKKINSAQKLLIGMNISNGENQTKSFDEGKSINIQHEIANLEWALQHIRFGTPKEHSIFGEILILFLTSIWVTGFVSILRMALSRQIADALSSELNSPD